MGEWCLNCGRIMKNKDLSHCSDECLMAEIKESQSMNLDGRGAETWDEESKPWT